MNSLTTDLERFAANAAEVSAMLKAMGNQRRLMVLCQLAEHGEMRVGDLALAVGLSQSALSQHLAVLREAVGDIPIAVIPLLPGDLAGAEALAALAAHLDGSRSR